MEELVVGNNSPFFSIIMPVYNAEDFLSKAINSILNQSYRDFELILVDDCSSDKSIELCEEYLQKDSRIKLIKNAVNSGPSVARNKGLDNATGKYIGFIDADDYIAGDLLRLVHEKVKHSNADIIKFGVIEEYYNEKSELVSVKKFSPGEFILKNQEDIYVKAVELELVPLFGYMWNSFYRNYRRNSTRIRLNPDIKVNEDFDYNVRLLKKIKIFQGIDYCGYYYGKRVNNSLSTRENKKYYEDHMRKISSFIGLFGDYDRMPEIVKSNVFWLYTRYVYSTLERVNGEDRYCILKMLMQDSYFQHFKRTSFINRNLKQKILICCLRSESKIIISILVDIIRLFKKKLPIIFIIVKR